MSQHDTNTDRLSEMTDGELIDKYNAIRQKLGDTDRCDRKLELGLRGDRIRSLAAERGIEGFPF